MISPLTESAKGRVGALCRSPAGTLRRSHFRFTCSLEVGAPFTVCCAKQPRLCAAAVGKWRREVQPHSERTLYERVARTNRTPTGPFKGRQSASGVVPINGVGTACRRSPRPDMRRMDALAWPQATAFLKWCDAARPANASPSHGSPRRSIWDWSGLLNGA